ncbi:MAG: efflux RND transporter periplasmic adaptor subunit [Pseudomonadota bacterium]
MRGADTAQDQPAQAAAEQTDAKPEVVVRPITLEPHTVVATLKGRTEADRAVAVKAETTGRVTATPAIEGSVVDAGATLCRLDVEAREVNLNRAKADFDAKAIEWNAARELVDKGWTSTSAAAAAKAMYDAAKASVDAAQIELDRTAIRAPFPGVFDRRAAEVGDFLSPGAECGTVIDLDPIRVVVEATEAQTARFSVGQSAEVELADGRIVDGTVRYVSRTSDGATRTFRVELNVANPDYTIAAGLTASIRVEVGEAPATLVSPALLVLHDDGRVGLRYVDETDRVQFTSVDIIDDAPTGVWVTGLPTGARLMASGQDYIREGIDVIPISAEGL